MAINEEQAQSVINLVVGEGDKPMFADDLMRPGDIALILRQEGGAQVLSYMDAGKPVDVNGESLDMAFVAARGMFVTALYNVAKDPTIMAEALTKVAENPPALKLHG